MKIQGSTIIVTGASAGIGLALAKELSKRGAKNIVMTARSADKLKAESANIPNSIPMAVDMASADGPKKLIADVKAKYGKIDALVNNAGVGLRAAIEKVDVNEYKAMMELNVFGVLRAMQAAIPVMREQKGGLILNVSSMVSKNYFPGIGAYASTKYALNALSLTARTELEADKIVVSVFHPRMTATDFAVNGLGEHGAPFSARPGVIVDTAELVAERIADQIESEAPESMMQ